MHLADPWDTILARKAEEAPGGLAPLITELEPDAPSAPQQIVITAKKIPPVPTIPPITDTWDRIMANRAKLPAPVQTYGWEKYVPWVIMGMLGVAAFIVLDKKKRARR